jgi:hypothetical protein
LAKSLYVNSMSSCDGGGAAAAAIGAFSLLPVEQSQNLTSGLISVSGHLLAQDSKTGARQDEADTVAMNG